MFRFIFHISVSISQTLYVDFFACPDFYYQSKHILNINQIIIQALGLNGQKLLGAPLVIQPTLAERNRAANTTVGSTLGFGPTATSGPLKLYVGQLHTSITEDMLTRIFDPFGKVNFLLLLIERIHRKLIYKVISLISKFR